MITYFFNTHAEGSTIDNRNFEESITDKTQKKELVEDKELGKGNHSENEGEKMQLSQSLDHAV